MHEDRQLTLNRATVAGTQVAVCGCPMAQGCEGRPSGANPAFREHMQLVAVMGQTSSW